MQKRRLIGSLALAAALAASGAGNSVFGADNAARPTAVSSNADVSELVGHALGLMRENKNQQAASELKRAIEIAPRSAEAHHNYGLSLAKLGDVPHAVEQFKIAIDIRPDLDSSWLTLAGLHQSVGHIDEAIGLYKQFLSRFADRTDLNDTRSKIEKLVEGLESESKTMRATRNASAALQSVGGATGVLQVPAAAVESGDYLAEATRSGIVRWPASRMPIRVFIADARAVPNFQPAWKSILMQSFNDWSVASNGKVKFQFVPTRDQTDIECTFVCDPTHDYGGLKTDAEAGEANMYMDATGIKQGTIKILTKSLSAVLPLTDNRMRVICLHEIGHALGLAGHTAKPDDIMFYSTSFKDEWRDLSGRDARTIQRLYGPD